MLSTMYRCGILLVTLAAVILGSPPQPDVAETPAPLTDQDDALALSDYCFFGSPSFLCYLRCSQQNLKPVCDEKQGLCVCTDPEDGDKDWKAQGIDMSTELPQSVASGASNDDADTNDEEKHHMIFYIFDLSSLFGNDAENATNSTEAPTGSPLPVEDVSGKEEIGTFKGWAFAHMLAVIIVALLCVLVLVELVACLKKQKAKHKEANLFTNSLGIPNKS